MRDAPLRLLADLLLLALLSLPLLAQAAPGLNYRNHAQRMAHLQQLVSAAQSRGLPVRLVQVGSSRAGRKILAVEMGFDPHAGAPPKGAPGSQLRAWGQRQALLVVAGLEANRPLDCAVALQIVATTLAGDAEALRARLKGHQLDVIPCVNPDGQERFFAASATRTGKLGNGRHLDRDRDGRLDEDPPDDLDGDGQIVQMRIREDAGTLMVDPDDERMLKKADPKKGERGIFSLHPEGLDQDGDGSWNEDGALGVELNRNFPQAFAEHDLAAGTFAASEPETRGLMDYCCGRPNIALVLVLGAHDNLVTPPKKSKPSASKKPARSTNRRRFRPSPRKLVTKVAADDADIFIELGKIWRKLTRLKSKDAGQADGAFHKWAYFQRGLPALAVNLFQVPDRKKAKKKKKKKKNQEEEKEGDRDEERKDQDPERKTPEKQQTKDARQESEQDVVAQNLKQRGRSGFLPWHKLSSGALGDLVVEVGGWKPYVRTTPSEELAQVIAGRVQKFVDDALDRFSHVHLEDLKIKRLAAGLYEIKASVLNDGWLPSSTKQGRVSRAVRPTLVELDVKQKDLLQGKRRHLVELLEAKAGVRNFRWVLHAAAGAELELRVAPPRSRCMVRKVVLP